MLLLGQQRCGDVAAGRRAVCGGSILPEPRNNIVVADDDVVVAAVGASNQVDEREATLAELLANFEISTMNFNAFPHEMWAKSEAVVDALAAAAAAADHGQN